MNTEDWIVIAVILLAIVGILYWMQTGGRDQWRRKDDD